jgi:sugar lactone lactonase YvrE
VLGDERFAQAESPRWLGGDRIVWVDMAARELHEGRLAGNGVRRTRTTHWPEGIGCATPVAGGARLLVATGRSLVLLDPDGARHVRAALPPGPDLFNDGVTDPHGRFWVGTQSARRRPTSALYALDNDGVIRPRLRGVTVSNGIGFSADGRTMYYIDTLPHRSVEAFDVAGNRLSHRRSLHRFARGNPDGMTMDRDGCIWVAVWDAGEVVRISPIGSVLERIALPARRPTAVALVSRRLIVTTARAGIESPGPFDGALLAIDVDTAGQATPAVILAAQAPVDREPVSHTG